MASLMVRICLIRHGSTSSNPEQFFIGQTINSPLSERGKNELLSRKTKNLYPAADAVYVSPLLRCVETARLLYPMLVPISLPSLMEMDYGEFEGKKYEQLKNDPAYKRWMESSGQIAPPLGESEPEFTQRLGGAMRQIAGDAVSHSIRSAVVVTHATCIAALIKRGYPGAAAQDLTEYATAYGAGWTMEMDIETLQFHSVRRI